MTRSALKTPLVLAAVAAGGVMTTGCLAGAAIGAAGAVVGAAVNVTGEVIEAGVEIVTPDGDDDKDEKDD